MSLLGRLTTCMKTKSCVPTRRFLASKSHGADPNEGGWEVITLVGVTTSVVVTYFGIKYAPNTRISDWARQEALARADMDPEEIEYGKQYGGIKPARYQKDEVGQRPSLV